MTVIKTIELIGVSDKSWDDAVKQALKEAAKTIRNIREVEIVSFSAKVENNNFTEYYAQVRLYFEVERP
ncbi:MAG: dodecin [Thermofilum sp. ex4484_82]|nr:MAG: dodecin [Thermofilum sp. ex4484_82]OYT37259.1 MAG: dodecin [Archaeoglobales archaeon ex4484_92]